MSTFNRVERTTQIIRNATLRFVRVAYPKVDPWGNSVYELAIIADDTGQKATWESMGLNVKSLGDGNECIVNLKKYALTKGGKEVPAPVVLDQFNNADTIDPASIGDGTVADISIIQYKSSSSLTGVSSILKAIKVVDLVEYDQLDAIKADFS